MDTKPLEVTEKSMTTIEALQTNRPEDNPAMDRKRQISPRISGNMFIIGDQRSKNSFGKNVKKKDVEPVQFVADNEEKLHEQGDSRETVVTSNELLNVFKERARSSATHRDDPIVIRRSSLLNDEVGTLPFAEKPAKSGVIENIVASSEQDRPRHGNR